MSKEENSFWKNCFLFTSIALLLAITPWYTHGLNPLFPIPFGVVRWFSFWYFSWLCGTSRAVVDAAPPWSPSLQFKTPSVALIVFIMGFCIPYKQGYTDIIVSLDSSNPSCSSKLGYFILFSPKLITLSHPYKPFKMPLLSGISSVLLWKPWTLCKSYFDW